MIDVQNSKYFVCKPLSFMNLFPTFSQQARYEQNKGAFSGKPDYCVELLWQKLDAVSHVYVILVLAL